jgi:hypothetical protein
MFGGILGAGYAWLPASVQREGGLSVSSGAETRIIPAGDGRDLCVEVAGEPDGKPIRPGYGGSTAHPGYTVASAAQDVRAIADALGSDRLGIWGISGGGPYALARGG